MIIDAILKPLVIETAPQLVGALGVGTDAASALLVTAGDNPERLRSEQAAGTVRPDIDAVTISNGIVALMLSMLMSVVQLGPQAAVTYSSDVASVFEAALGLTP